MFDPINHSNQYRQSTTASSNFQANSADRMKMEYLKKEKERREKERYKMEYDTKKRELDRFIQDKNRYELDKKRIEIELKKYETDTLTNLRDQKKYTIEKTNLSDEEKQVNQKIQLLEVELQQLKNKSQRLRQDREATERKDRDILLDINKKNSYIQSLKLKLDAAEKNLANTSRQVSILESDLNRLKKYSQ